MDALNQPRCGLDVETAAGSYGNAAKIGSSFLACRYYGPHQIPGLKPECAFAAGEVSAWEPMLRQARALVTAASCALDFQHRNPPIGNSVDFAHANRIQGMRFGDVKPMPVPLRAPARSNFDRQGCPLEPMKQRPARAVGGSRITQWRFSMGLDAGQSLRVFRQKFGDILVGFALVARTAGQREITHAVTPAL
jgi:hypothetical protein